MKINPSTLPCILFLFISITSCQDDDTAAPVPPPKPTVAQPEPLDTLNLLPFPFVHGDTTFGLAQGIWQDSFFWEASGQAGYYNPDPDNSVEYLGIGFANYAPPYNFLRHVFGVSKIPKHVTVGDYTIHEEIDDNDGLISAEFFILGDDGDVFENAYTLDEIAGDNKLFITEADTVNGIYRGSFTVSFERVGAATNPNNPDYIKMKNVKFWAKIVE